jgi:hypothetical protein
MIMKSQMKKRLLGMTGLAAMLLLVSSAQAVDLRSWDQKIDQGQKRFAVLSSFQGEAVLDKETQLVWQRSPSAVYASMTYAKDVCSLSTVGGRMGWRLPYATELRSLISTDHADPSTPALPPGHPFTGVAPATGRYYWTNSRHPFAEQWTALGIYPGYLYSVWDFPGTEHAVWCVRGPTSE